jgi:hypothetical protein
MKVDTTRYQFYPYIGTLISKDRQDSELTNFLMYAFMSIGAVAGGYLSGASDKLLWFWIFLTSGAMGIT